VTTANEVRHRDAGVGGDRHRGAHPGHDLERDPGLREGQRLLAAPAEHERVAALQAHHEPTGAGVLDQERVDPGLRQAVGARVLAREDAEGARRRLVEQRRVDQAIVDDHARSAEDLDPAHGHEARIARPRSDQVDAPRLGHADSRLRRSRTRASR
jgi:hypothetical protein